MKTAFFTSILGMGISFACKYYQADAQKNFSENNSVKSDATVADLIQYLRQADAKKSERIKHLEEILQANNANIIRELNDFGNDISKESFKLTSDTVLKMEQMMKENDKNFNESLKRSEKQ